MTIKRSTPGTGITSLGRVSVTIDDLDALLEILTTGHPARPQRPRVEFVGGSFDSPEDLRKLNSAEMSSLRIVAKHVEVILTESAALAIGQQDHVDEVYSSWAGVRQTKRRRQFVSKGYEYLTQFLSVLLMAAAVNFSAIALTGSLRNMDVSMIDKRSPAANLLFAIASATISWAAQSNIGAGRNYAIITPQNNEEARKETKAELLARRAWWVAVASATIAAFGTLINFLIKK